MELDVRIEGDSLSIPIADPFRIDLDAMMTKIESFAGQKGVSLAELDVRGLIPKMIKGIAGCENGCPSDAKGFVSRGMKNFKLEYVEGGILTAKASAGGRNIDIKMFPDF